MLKEQIPVELRRRLKYLLKGWSANFRRLPSIIGIGVQKAGTTSLYQWLIQHPQIIANTGEVHYFDFHYNRGESWYRSNFPLNLFLSLRESLLQKKVKTCEVTPNYLFAPQAIPRMKNLLPDSKLLVLLRDPVDRAISHYYHQVHKGREERRFNEAIQYERQLLESNANQILDANWFRRNKMQHFSYLARGLYHIQLRRLFRYYSREQVLVLESEKLFRRKKDPLLQLCDFLGIEKNPPPFPQKNTRTYPEVDDETIESIHKFFRPHNQELGDLLGRPFSWTS